jgi:hypothetical protein
LTAEETGEKAVQVRGGETPKSLEIEVTPLKTEFEVGEALRFDIRGNREFFLYLYNVDPDNGDSVLLLPSAQHKGNKYPAQKKIRVPNKDVEFYADKPGTERFVLIASTRYIEADTARMKQAGDFMRGSTKELENQFESKTVGVRAPAGKKRHDTIVKQIDVAVAGEVPDSGIELPEGEDKPATVVLLSTDRDQYVEGQDVHIAYGADQAGWLHLYLVVPGGKRELLLRKQVDGDSLVRTRAKATAPFGEQTLMAAWSAAEDLDEDQLTIPAASDSQSKNLALEPDDSVPTAIKRFTIKSAN